jgi:hypothetical protein
MERAGRRRLRAVIAVALAWAAVACGGGGGESGPSGDYGGDPSGSSVPAGLVGSWVMVEQNGSATDKPVYLTVSANGTYYFLVRNHDGSFLRDFTAVFTYVDEVRYEAEVVDASCDFDPCSPRIGLRFANNYVLSGGQLVETDGDFLSIYERR